MFRGIPKYGTKPYEDCELFFFWETFMGVKFIFLVIQSVVLDSVSQNLKS